uniref:Ankyrin repeat and SOCS box protein 3-like n=1 Tax=Phallusia mammillata TaxID=59560 RepID=A0A6F9D7G8_9ASCI|nr:ankyrin repeat and SOCS box protein 3-like [Phallusia mammillata]
MDFTEAYDDTCSQVGFAARSGNIELLRSLLSSGKDYCVHDNRGWYPIHEAAEAGNVESITELLQVAANNDDNILDIWPVPFNKTTGTPLEIAVRNGHLAAVEVLLPLYRTAVADPSNILTEAVCYPSVLAVLIEAYPLSINTCSSLFSEPPLHRAVSCVQLESIKMLLENGADKEGSDIFGRKPLHMAASLVNSKSIDVLLKLLDAGCNINSCDKDGCTPLYIAAQSNLLESAELLLSNGADAHIPCVFLNDEQHKHFKVAPISAAAEKGFDKMLRLLINSTDCNLLGKDHITSPVLSAIIGEQPGCLEVLLKSGYLTSGLLPGSNENKMSKSFKYGDLVLENLLPWDFSSTNDHLCRVIALLLQHRVKFTSAFVQGPAFNVLISSETKTSYEVLQVMLVYGLVEFCFTKLPTSIQLASMFDENILTSSLPSVVQSKLAMFFSFVPNFHISFTSGYPYITLQDPTLQQLCCWKIRQLFQCNHRPIIQLNDLPIPKKVINQVLFRYKYS